MRIKKELRERSRKMIDEIERQEQESEQKNLEIQSQKIKNIQLRARSNDGVSQADKNLSVSVVDVPVEESTIEQKIEQSTHDQIEIKVENMEEQPSFLTDNSAKKNHLDKLFEIKREITIEAEFLIA